MAILQSAVFAGTVWEKLLEWYHQSVIRELLVYFDETYFSFTPINFQHFSISVQTASSVKRIILGIAVGIIVAALISCYVKTVHGGFVRKLLRDGCNTPKTAKSLYELGYFRSVSIRNQLRHGGAVASLVKGVGTAGEPVSADPDFSTARFYIPEESRYRAEFRYEKKGSGVRSVILTILITLLVAVLLCRFLPQLFGLADLILGIFQ